MRTDMSLAILHVISFSPPPPLSQACVHSVHHLKSPCFYWNFLNLGLLRAISPQTGHGHIHPQPSFIFIFQPSFRGLTSNNR